MTDTDRSARLQEIDRELQQIRSTLDWPLAEHEISYLSERASVLMAEATALLEGRAQPGAATYYPMRTDPQGVTVSCPRCGRDQPARTDFCLACGFAISVRCPVCGSSVPLLAAHCGSCGAEVGAVPPGFVLERAKYWRQVIGSLDWWDDPNDGFVAGSGVTLGSLLTQAGIDRDGDGIPEYRIFSCWVDGRPNRVSRVWADDREYRARKDRSLLLFCTRARIAVVDLRAGQLMQFPWITLVRAEVKGAGAVLGFHGGAIAFRIEPRGARLIDQALLFWSGYSGRHDEVLHYVAADNVARARAEGGAFMEVLAGFVSEAVALVGK